MNYISSFLSQLKKLKIGKIEIIFLLLNIILLIRYKIGNNHLRMAIASGDDNPITFAMKTISKNDFKNDAYLNYIQTFQEKGILNWFGVLLKLVNTNSQTIWNLFLITQIILMFAGVRYFILKLNGSRNAVVLCWTLVTALQPYYWNLNSFSALDDQPYAFWMVIPLLMFLFGKFLDNTIWKANFLLIIIYLIHPAMGIVTFLFVMVLSQKNQYAKNIKSLAPATLFIFVFSTLIFLLTYKNSIHLPPYLIETVKSNLHLTTPFPDKTNNREYTLILWALTLSSYFFIVKSSVGKKSRTLQIFAHKFAAYLFLWSTIQYLSLKFGIFPALPLMGTRLTAVLALIFLCTLTVTVVDQKKMLPNLVILFFIFIPNPIFVLLYLALQRKIKILQIPILFLGAVGFVSTLYPSRFNAPLLSNFLEVSQFNIGSYLFSSARISPIPFLLTFLLGVIYLTLSETPTKKRITFSNFAFMFFTGSLSVMTMLGFQYQYQFSFNNNTWRVEEVRDFADAQGWASSNTGRDSVFLVFPNEGFVPWRTLSERSAVTNELIQSPYGYTRKASEWNSLLMNKSRDTSSFTLTSQNFCNFISISNVRYFVEHHNMSKFSEFGSKVFENDSVTIYRANCD
jgi:hypothetical protein